MTKPLAIIAINSVEEADLLWKGFVHGVYGGNSKAVQSMIMKIETAHALAHERASQLTVEVDTNGEEASENRRDTALVS